MVSRSDVPRIARQYSEIIQGLRIMHAVPALTMMLLIGMLVNAFGGPPFVIYDLRVNGAIIKVIAAAI